MQTRAKTRRQEVENSTINDENSATQRFTQEGASQRMPLEFNSLTTFGQTTQEALTPLLEILTLNSSGKTASSETTGSSAGCR